MRVYVCQFYIQQGAEFPFSHIFQRFMYKEITRIVAPSEKFIEKYGGDFSLIINVSAKHELEEIEVLGPTVFRKDKDVEYSVFLPFSAVALSDDPPETALGFIFNGVYSVFDKYEIDSSSLRKEQRRLTKTICSDPTMFRVSRHAGTGIGPPVWSEYIKE